jgi:hypothetical protein
MPAGLSAVLNILFKRGHRRIEKRSAYGKSGRRNGGSSQSERDEAVGARTYFDGRAALAAASWSRCMRFA